MPPDESANVALLEHAKCFYGLLSADAILEYLCRETQKLVGAHLTVGSCIPPGELWQRGLHIAVDQCCARATPAVVSATFAIHRRLSAKAEALQLSRSEESAAIFRGLLGEAHPEAVVWAFPLLNRKARLVGQVVVVAPREEAVTPSSIAAIRDIACLASLALENAQRLAFARRDQERLLLLAEATEEALWDWDLESNAFWWGGGIQNVIKDGGEVIGTTAGWRFERIHPADLGTVQASLERARSSTASTWREEYRFRRGDGSWAIVEDRAYLLRDAAGRPYRMLGALRDISDKKWIEAQQKLLVHASAALAASLEVEKNLETVAELAATTVADWCSIVLFGSENGKPTTIAVAHRDPERAGPLPSVLEGILREPNAVAAGLATAAVIPDFTEEHHRLLLEREPALAQALAGFALRSVLHVPLLTGGRVLGWITLLTSSESMRSYGPADVAFAEEFARRCGVAVDKARLYDKLRTRFAPATLSWPSSGTSCATPSRRSRRRCTS